MNQKQFIESGNYLIDEVKTRSEKLAKHFFDRDTLKFFSSRISELCWKKGNDIFFITSEADNSSIKHAGSVRSWTVRKSTIEGDIITGKGEFQKHASLNDARKAIKEVIEN